MEVEKKGGAGSNNRTDLWDVVESEFINVEHLVWCLTRRKHLRFDFVRYCFLFLWNDGLCFVLFACFLLMGGESSGFFPPWSDHSCMLQWPGQVFPPYLCPNEKELLKSRSTQKSFNLLPVTSIVFLFLPISAPFWFALGEESVWKWYRNNNDRERTGLEFWLALSASCLE